MSIWILTADSCTAASDNAWGEEWDWILACYSLSWSWSRLQPMLSSCNHLGCHPPKHHEVWRVRRFLPMTNSAAFFTCEAEWIILLQWSRSLNGANSWMRKYWRWWSRLIQTGDCTAITLGDTETSQQPTRQSHRHQYCQQQWLLSQQVTVTSDRTSYLNSCFNEAALD